MSLLRSRALLAAGMSASLLAGVAVASVAQASPDPPGRTRGDAQAVLEAGFTGGTNINLLHIEGANGVPTGIVPTGDPEDVRIYPFSEDAAYCASGWHVLNFNIGDSLEFYDSREELVEVLASIDILYEIDGTLVETQRTATKQALGFDDGPGLWVGIAALLPPGTLTVGAHELTTTYIDPRFGSFPETVTFDILPC